MDLVNVAHLHLLLNHVPTIGTVVGLGLLLLALVRKNEHVSRASLEVFFVVGLLTLPAYLTGVAAQAAIQGRPDVSTALIGTHEDAALQAFVFMQMTGVVAWFGLWRCRRIGRPARWDVGAVLLLATITMVLMARAATVGGEIRHPEIRPDQAATAAPGTVDVEAEGEAPGGDALVLFVTETPWVWRSAETIHFVGLCLLFGILFPVNLRLLGVMKDVPFAALHRLLPWAMLGFGINLVTGMAFFIGMPDQYTANGSFYWKIALLLLAGVNFLYITVADDAWALEKGDDARLGDKGIAASAIGLWIGVMYCGRMLPFLGNAF